MNGHSWDSWGISLIGPAHRRRGITNQDFWIAQHCHWGDVIAVSDGLGSCPKSHIGSKAACQSVVEATKIYLASPCRGVERLLYLIHSLWSNMIFPHSPEECSATCLFVVRYDKEVIFAQLGDGMVVACRNDGAAELLVDAKDDSFSNMTDCFGSVTSIDNWRFVRNNLAPYQAFVLCTDGIVDDIIPEKRTSFATELFLAYRNYEQQERMEEIQKWLNEWPVSGHSDDKTVACLFRIEK